MVYSPFEYFCKFMVEKKKKERKKKQASLKSQKVRIFKNHHHPLPPSSPT